MTVTRRSLAETYEAQDLIIQAAQEAKREATHAYRQHLDGVGMDKDAIKAEVEAFKKASRRKMDGQKKGVETVEHVDAIADEIFLEITASRAPRATRVENIEEFDAETGEITEPQGNEVAASPAQMPSADGVAPAKSAATTSPDRVEGIADGQPIQPETANEQPRVEAHDAEGDTQNSNAVADVPATQDGNANTGGKNEIAAQPEPVILDRRPVEPAPDEGHTGNEHQRVGHFETNKAPAGRVADESPAPITYAEPGIVVMENTPPEGVVTHPYVACWPVNNIDVTDGIREPIVKIGNLILDGRGRYFAARAALIDYPVVQYDGNDALLDCIRWNMASRPGLHPHNLNIIATKLVKLEPSRADDIMQAMGLEQAEAAE